MKKGIRPLSKLHLIVKIEFRKRSIVEYGVSDMDASREYAVASSSSDASRLTFELASMNLSDQPQDSTLTASVNGGRVYATMHTSTPTGPLPQHILPRWNTEPILRPPPLGMQTIAYHDPSGVIVALKNEEIAVFNETLPLIISKLHEHHYLIKFPYHITDKQHNVMKQVFYHRIRTAATPGAKFYLDFTSEGLASCEDCIESITQCLKGKEISIKCDLSGYTEEIPKTCPDAARLQEIKKLVKKNLLKIFNIAEQFQCVDFSNCPEFPKEILQILLQKCRNVKELILSGCRQVADEMIICIVEHLKKLSACAVSGCKTLTDYAFIALVNFCPELVVLDASDTNVTDAFFEHVRAKNRTFAKLLLSGCTEVTDSTLSIMATWSRPLYSLDLGNCPNISVDGVQRVHTNVTDELLLTGLSSTICAFEIRDPARQNYSRDTFLSRSNELQLLMLRQYLHGFFKNSCAQVVGNWLKITIGKSEDEEMMFADDQLLFSEFIPFIQKHRVHLKIGISAFVKTHTASYKFLQEISPHVMHLRCIDEQVLFSSQYAKEHRWSFISLESLNLSGCPCSDRILSSLAGLALHSLKLRRCKGITAQNVAFAVNQNFPKLAKLDVRQSIHSYQELVSLFRMLSLSVFIRFKTEAQLSGRLVAKDALDLLQVLCQESDVHARVCEVLCDSIIVTVENVLELFMFASTHQVAALMQKCRNILGQILGFHNQLSYNGSHFTLVLHLHSVFVDNSENLLIKFLQTQIKNRKFFLKVYDTTVNEIDVVRSKVAPIVTLLQANENEIIGFYYYNKKQQNDLPSQSSSTSKKRFFFQPRSNQADGVCFYDPRPGSFDLSLVMNELKKSAFSSLKSLAFENLSKIEIESLIGCIANFQAIKNLYFKNCELSSACLKTMLIICSEVTSLAITECTTFSSSDLADISFCCKITDLDLTGCVQVTDVGFLMRSMPRLERLTLERTSVMDSSFQGFAMENLRMLNLAFTAITDQTVIQMCPGLSELILDGTKVTKKSFETPEGVSLKITDLCLKYCPHLNDKEEVALGFIQQVARSCPDLSVIDLSTNGYVTEDCIITLLRSCEHLETIIAKDSRPLMHLYTELQQDKRRKTLFLDFSDSACFQQHTVEIYLRKTPFAKNLHIQGFYNCSILQWQQILQFYPQNYFKNIHLEGFLGDISGPLQVLQNKSANLSTLTLSGAITNETVLQANTFQTLRRLEIRNTMQGGCAAVACTKETLALLTFAGLELLVLEQLFSLTTDTLDTIITHSPRLHTIDLVLCLHAPTQNFTLDGIGKLHKKYETRITLRCTYYDEAFREKTIIFPRSEA